MQHPTRPFDQIPLPDGTFVMDWRKEMAYTRTYIVDQNHPAAADHNPGTENLPLASIGKAAILLRPGEQVLVKNGLYREWVRPVTGGSGPGMMIRYAAFPGHKPIIRASKLMPAEWQPDVRDAVVFRDNTAGRPHVWTLVLPITFFKEWSPLMMENLTDGQFYGMGGHFQYYYEKFRGRAPYSLRRALLFCNGQRLTQTNDGERLARHEMMYRVEEDGRTIHISMPPTINPNTEMFEVSCYPQCFAPTLPGLHFIQVEGFVMEHAGNGFAYPMAGALSPNFGHHWIMQHNHIRDCNGAGIDVGVQVNRPYDFYYENGGGYIVSHNVVEECGFAGILGSHVENTVLEFNTVRRCCWHDTELYYENGAVKFLYNRRVLVRGNHISHIRKAVAIWLDWACETCRVYANLVHDIHSMFGGIFMEASRIPNMVDNNIVWQIDGNGIYQHDCDNLVIAHNLLVDCTQHGIKLWLCEGRNVLGKPTDCMDNRVFNNLCIRTVSAVLTVNDRNRIWNNPLLEPIQKMSPSSTHAVPLHPSLEEVRPPLENEGAAVLESRTQAALPAPEHCDLRLVLNAETLAMAWSGTFPEGETSQECVSDFWGIKRDAFTLAGPFGVVPNAHEFSLV